MEGVIVYCLQVLIIITKYNYGSADVSSLMSKQATRFTWIYGLRPHLILLFVLLAYLVVQGLYRDRLAFAVCMCGAASLSTAYVQKGIGQGVTSRKARVEPLPVVKSEFHHRPEQWFHESIQFRKQLTCRYPQPVMEQLEFQIKMCGYTCFRYRNRGLCVLWAILGLSFVPIST